MKLQLAIDTMPLGQAISFGSSLADLVDIFEIGTPLMLREGVHAVRAFREAFPQHEVLADTKIMDGGYFESELMFAAGADYITVLGAADPSTIKGCVAAGRDAKRKVVVDLLCVDELAVRGADLDRLGADLLAVHTGADQQAGGRTPLGDLRTLRGALPTAGVAVAGGISPTTIHDYTAELPDVVIVGSAICDAPDPRAAARALSQAVRSFQSSKRAVPAHA